MKIDEMSAPKLFWARPPAATTGDDKSSTIYEAVGRAITIWETFEIGLLFLYLGLIECHTEAARRAYGSIISAAGRRDAINAAAESCFLQHHVSAEDMTRHKKLMDHVGNAVGRRNDIAHGAVMNVEGHGCFLYPAYYSTPKNRPFPGPNPGTGNVLDILPGEYRYTKADIDHFCERFGQLNFAMQEYSRHLSQTYLIV